MLRRCIQIGLSLLGLYVVLSIAAGIYLAGAAIHPHRRHVTGRARYAEIVEGYSSTGVEDAAVDAMNHAELKGWYVQPDAWNHEAVLLLHGVADNREGVAGYSAMFLKAGYAVLLPDSRAWRERWHYRFLWRARTTGYSSMGRMVASTREGMRVSLRRIHGCCYCVMTVTHGLCAVRGGIPVFDFS
jgi:hypothetical protein